jgi:hypothetical protein
MVSSLLHVLVVTPVVFYWLRARHLPREADVEVAPSAMDARTRRPGVLSVVVTVALVAATAVAWWIVERPGAAPAERVVLSVRAGEASATLRSESGALTRGRNQFYVEFRDAAGALVDVGDVRLTTAMPMPGMVMSGGVEVLRTSRPGRYLAIGEFTMSGVWQMTLQWSGTAHPGSTSFQGSVQ